MVQNKEKKMIYLVVVFLCVLRVYLGRLHPKYTQEHNDSEASHLYFF